MNGILFMFLIFCAILLTAMLLSSVYMNFLLRYSVGRKHRLIESILNTSEVPESWSRNLNRKIEKLGRKTGYIEKAAYAVQQAQKCYLKRIDALIKYLKTTSMVENEEVRRDILEQMQQIRTIWEGRYIKNE